MSCHTAFRVLAPVVLVSFGASVQAQTTPSGGANMTFFITSVGPGKGADLGGLEGADRHCQSLASAVGAGGKPWRAYLSTQGPGAVNARDRIGRGPWQNTKGEVIAKDVDELHGSNNLTKQTAVTETGEVVKGSQSNGRAFTGNEDMTCGNWTKSGADGGTMLGHHDRMGGGEDPTSWNAAHRSRGCSQDGLRSTG